MTTKLPAAVELVLKEYLSRVTKHAPGILAGLYLQGSVALNAFDERSSDVDFIAILERRPGQSEIEALAAVHQEVGRKYPSPSLEGSYLQWKDLGHFPEEIEPYPCFHDGRLHPSAYHDLNSVTWWILKNHGIAVIGPPPEALDFAVDWDLLIRNMAVNLNTYWLDWTRNPKRKAILLTDWGIQWAVLGISRQFYTFQEDDIVSKTAAGEYVLSRVPAKWHRLVQEALGIRTGRRESHYRSKIARQRDAIGFLKYVIGYCNARIPLSD